MVLHNVHCTGPEIMLVVDTGACPRSGMNRWSLNQRIISLAPVVFRDFWYADQSYF